MTDEALAVVTLVSLQAEIADIKTEIETNVEGTDHPDVEDLNTKVDDLLANIEVFAQNQSNNAEFKAELEKAQADLEIANGKIKDLQAVVDAVPAQVKPLDEQMKADFTEIYRIVKTTKGANHPLVAKLDSLLLSVAQAVID